MLFRSPFAWSAAGLTAVAFAGSFDHTHATIIDYGQTGWVAVATALMPEVSVALSVLQIRMGGTSTQIRWAWLVLATSAAFTVWANLMQAVPSVGGWVVGGWPAWAAIGAAGFLKIGHPPVPRRVPRSGRAAQPAGSAVGGSSSGAGVAGASRVSGTSVGTDGGSPSTAASTATPSGLSLVPTRGDGPRAAAVAAARAFRAEHGRLPSLGELVGMGVSASTAKRALNELRSAA